MSHRAQRPGIGVGGHISTYASSAALYEVGFNHFFRRGRSFRWWRSDLLPGYASPGTYGTRIPRTVLPKRNEMVSAKNFLIKAADSPQSSPTFNALESAAFFDGLNGPWTIN
jgi:hypothetical protein